MSKTYSLQNNCFYDLQVHEVNQWSRAGVGEFDEFLDVIFLVTGRHSPSSPGTGTADRPKACITLRFDSNWTPRDEGTRILLCSLEVPTPIPDGFDWDAKLAGRRVLGRFDKPPRDGARNPLGDVRPAGQVQAASARTLTDGEAAETNIHTGVEVLPDAALSAGSGSGTSSLRPHWDAVLRCLTWDGKVVAEYRRPARSQTTILSAFEEEGWPRQIYDPLTGGKLRQTLKDLQEKFQYTPIEFEADGTGSAIRWRPRAL